MAGASGFQARHTRIAGAAGLAFDFGVFFADALGSAFGFAAALGLELASALAAGVAAASFLNGQFSRVSMVCWSLHQMDFEFSIVPE